MYQAPIPWWMPVSFTLSPWVIRMPLLAWIVGSVIMVQLGHLCFRLIRLVIWGRRWSHYGQRLVLGGYDALFRGQWQQAHRLFSRATHTRLDPLLSQLNHQGGQWSASLLEKKAWSQPSAYPLMQTLTYWMQGHVAKAMIQLESHTLSHRAQLTLLSWLTPYHPRRHRVANYLRVKQCKTVGPRSRLAWVLAEQSCRYCRDQSRLEDIWRTLPRAWQRQTRLLKPALANCRQHHLDASCLLKALDDCMCQHAHAKLLADFLALSQPDIATRINHVMQWRRHHPNHFGLARALACLYVKAGYMPMAEHVLAPFANSHRKAVTQWRETLHT